VFLILIFSSAQIEKKSTKYYWYQLGNLGNRSFSNMSSIPTNNIEPSPHNRSEHRTPESAGVLLGTTRQHIAASYAVHSGEAARQQAPPEKDAWCATLFTCLLLVACFFFLLVGGCWLVEKKQDE
jgi:hypothetical protein